MKFRATKSQSAGSQPKVGTHVARLVGIVDLGLRPSFIYEGKTVEPEYKLEFTYELVNSTMEDGRPHYLSEEVANKLSKEGAQLETKLAKRIQAMGGDRSDPATMLGNPCIVTVKHKDTWAKIDSVGGVPEGLPVKELTNKPFFFDLDNPNLEVFNNLPEFRRNKILDNLEYEGSKLQQLLDMQS